MIIAPSLLAADFGRLTEETRRAERAQADWLHLDIMDGHFVPNISFGPAVVRTVRPLTSLLFDVHLMCSKPEILIEPFSRAGADSLTIHVELDEQVRPLIRQIRAAAKKVGLAVNPPTPVTALLPYLSEVDLILVMTVNPGFGGQEFMRETLTKIQQVSAWRRERSGQFRIEVDGGITVATAQDCARAGADTFVSGTGLFGEEDMADAVSAMRAAVREGCDEQERQAGARG